MKRAKRLGRNARLLAAAGLLGLQMADPASAQLFFRPFFQPFAYSYHDHPIEDEGPAPYASRRAVAMILAREGYRLVGPLGRRGEQIVANGYSRRDGDMRFIVDPYEGRIIRGIRLGQPPDDFSTTIVAEDSNIPTIGGSRADVPELGNDPPRAPRPHRDRRTAHREAPAHREMKEAPQALPDLPRSEPRPSAATAPAANPNAKPETKPQTKPDVTPASAPPAERTTPRVVYPYSSEPAPPPPPPPKPDVTERGADSAKDDAKPATTDQAVGGSSHRAIVPPPAPAN